MRPQFSLIIPLAPWRDAEILKSIKKLNYPKENYEVLVEKGLNPSKNRNRGAKRSGGKVVVFLDDDAVLPANFLNELEKFFREYPDIDVVGGPQLTPESDGFFAKTSGYALESKFGGLKLSARYKRGRINLDADECSITSANLACKREVMKEVNFDPTLFPGEDPKFIDDCKKRGFKVACSPNIYLYHRRRDSLWKLAKQIFTYGKTRPEKERITETLKKPFFLLPAALILYILLLPLLITAHWSFGLYLFVYLAVNLLVSLFIALREKTFFGFFILPIIMLTIHLSYGVGIIYGIFKSALTHRGKA